MRSSPLVLAALPVLGDILACSNDSAKSSPQPASAASSEVSVPAPTNMGSLQGRFAAEAKGRPTGTVRVEDVLTAFAHAGVELHDTRQQLAAPFDAAYCGATKAGHDLQVIVCEYVDEAKATKGREMSAKAFKSVGRETVQNKATTLTLRRGDGNVSDAALRDELLDTFQKMPAPAASGGR